MPVMAATSSIYPKLVHIFNICKNTKHLKSLKSLLIVHGLIQQELLLGRFLRSCFDLGAPDIALSAIKIIKTPNAFLQNVVVRALSSYGLYEDVLSVYANCRASSCSSDDYTFPSVIKACSILGAFRIGRQIHCVVLRTGFDQNVVIQTALVDFYARLGYMGIARALIDRIPQPDLVSWNALIAGYSFCGLYDEVFEAFKQIFVLGLKPNFSTLASVIPVCTRLGCLDVGKSLHGFAVKSGFFVNDFLVPALISMYAIDVHSSDSRNLFDSVEEKNVVVWNAMISAYTQKQMPFRAFEIFQEMLCTDVMPDSVTFVSIIPSCEIAGRPLYGESLHAGVVKHGLENRISVLTALVTMYSRFGDIHKAEYLFNSMPNRNLLRWNVMISGYVHNGLWDASLDAFYEMQFSGFSPDMVSIVTVLSACSELQAISVGKSVHAFSIRKGIDSNLNVSNALLAFYSDCNNLTSSLKLFHKMNVRNIVSWNTLISGYVHKGQPGKAAELIYRMQKQGMALDLVTLISILPIYHENDSLVQGMTLHGCAIKNGLTSDVSLLNALISMYCKCGDLCAGRLLFESMSERCVVSWNALITGYRHYDKQSEILSLFSQLIKEGERPNSVTLLNLLPVCSSDLQGKSIHAFAIRRGILRETPFLTALMHMYSRFENMNSFLLLFETDEKRDISLWNAIISVHVQRKDGKKAVTLFSDLLRIDLQPDNITVLSLVLAGAQLNSLNLAHSIFAYVVHKGFDKDMVISNALIDLFAKSGSVLTARRIFEGLLEKDAVSWGVMINGYSVHGDAEAALELFSQMQFSGVRADEIIFLSVLSACSRAGLVEQGRVVINSMVEHGISPTMNHFTCMVNLLGRTGHLNEAYDIIKKLPCKPSIMMLESLLGACRTHGNVELGQKISEMLFVMAPENSGSYVMLSGIYAAAGQWLDSNKVRANMDRRQLKKVPGISLLLRDERH